MSPRVCLLRPILVLCMLSSLGMISCKPPTEPAVQRSLIDDRYGIEMIYVPAGDLEWEAGPTRHAMTVHIEGFYLGKYEVTQAQWKAVMGEYPTEFDWDSLPVEFTVEGAISDRARELAEPTEFIGDNLPVETVSWIEAREFLRKLSEATGHDYRLPTAAEWEYSCRAGTRTDYYFGDDPAQLVEYEWYEANSGGQHRRVDLDDR